MTNDQPRYAWRETWPGEGKPDFVGYDGKEIVGRVRLDTTTATKTGLWRWNGGFASFVRRRVMPQQGWAETARAASRMAEEHYDRLKDVHSQAQSQASDVLSTQFASTDRR